MVRSSISTSSEKTTAAMGALKIPAMAPEAPAPIRMITVFWFSLNSLPRYEPMELPVSTIGASSPTEPPKATVKVLPTIEEYMLCLSIRPFFFEMEYKILLTPCPISALKTYLASSTVMVIPITGKKR